MIVQKFGGSCLNRPDDLRRMVRIIKSTEPIKPKIVLSAFKGVTDELIRQANLAKEGSFDISGISTTHLRFLDALPSMVQAETAPQVRQLLDELNRKLTQVANRGKLPLSALDDLVAYGEKLAIIIASGYMAEQGMHAEPLSGEGAGITTDGVFGNACILEESSATVKAKLVPVHLPLVAGFFGADKAGRITTLGRGASDYVAAFIAAALGCKVVLFKDVDGVMTADPKVVPKAKLIPKLGYQAALEMARYGSKVLFEKAVIQACKAQIQIEVRSFEKLNEGTVVAESGEGEAVSYTKSLSLVDATHLSNFRKASSILSKLDEAYGWNSPIFASMFRNGLVIAIGDSQVEHVSRIAESASVLEVSVRKGISVVALTGRRFRVSQVADVIRATRVEPLGVFKTPSGMTTCVLLDASATETAVNALHTLLEN